jgi:hypothetical protein
MESEFFMAKIFKMVVDPTPLELSGWDIPSAYARAAEHAGAQVLRNKDTGSPKCECATFADYFSRAVFFRRQRLATYAASGISQPESSITAE